MTTNEYIRGVKQSNLQRFNKRIWQRSYFERIVRSDLAYFFISRYIRNNPVNWTKDRMNKILHPKIFTYTDILIFRNNQKLVR